MEKASRPLYTPAGWLRLHPVVRTLLTVRLLRSVAQGALIVDFSLYLKALGWSTAAIGTVIGATGLVGATLMTLSGPLSDKLGRRMFLVRYEWASIGLTTLMLLVPSTYTLVLATVLLGFGIGANGAAGPFGPVEEAWLSQYVVRGESGRVFSLNSALGFVGNGLGAFTAGLVPRWAQWLPGVHAYLPLFWLVLLASAVNLWQISHLPDVPGQRATGSATGSGSRSATQADKLKEDDPQAELAIRRQENRSLLLVGLINSINAIGIGLFSPLAPLWFATRFGVGPSSLGEVFGITAVLTSVAALLAGELADRVGMVKAVVWMRLVGVAVLAAIPLVPSYAWASALYITRSLLNRSSSGVRSAFGVNLVRPHRRGLASSVTALSFRLPTSIGPVIAGWLTAMGQLNLPVFVAAGMQLTYVVLFGLTFRQKPAKAVRTA